MNFLVLNLFLNYFLLFFDHSSQTNIVYDKELDMYLEIPSDSEDMDNDGRSGKRQPKEKPPPASSVRVVQMPPKVPPLHHSYSNRPWATMQERKSRTRPEPRDMEIKYRNRPEPRKFEPQKLETRKPEPRPIPEKAETQKVCVDIAAESSKGVAGLRGGTMISGPTEVKKFLELFETPSQQHLRRVTEGYNQIRVDVEGPSTIGGGGSRRFQQQQKPTDTVPYNPNYRINYQYYDDYGRPWPPKIDKSHNIAASSSRNQQDNNFDMDLLFQMDSPPRSSTGSSSSNSPPNDKTEENGNKMANLLSKIGNKTWRSLPNWPSIPGGEKAKVVEGIIQRSNSERIAQNSEQNTENNSGMLRVKFNPPTKKEQEKWRQMLLNHPKHKIQMEVENKFNHDGHNFGTLSAIPDRVQEIKADGDCMFRSLSYVLAGTEELHVEVRHLILDFYRKYVGKEAYLPREATWLGQMLLIDRFRNDHFHHNFPTIQAYVDYMSMPNKWGGLVDLVAATKVFRVNVCLFYEDWQCWICYSPNTTDQMSSGQDPNFPTAFLQYLIVQKMEHYNVVLSVKRRT